MSAAEWPLARRLSAAVVETNIMPALEALPASENPMTENALLMS